MHATQHLPKGKIKRAQAAFACGALVLFVLRTITMRVTLTRICGLRQGLASMPRGMHERALLRNQQQRDKQKMEIAAGHGKKQKAEQRVWQTGLHAPPAKTAETTTWRRSPPRR